MKTKNKLPVVVCKYNKEIFNYLYKNFVPIVYVEDVYDAQMFSADVAEYKLHGKYRINDLNNVTEILTVAAQIKIDHPEVKIVISPNEYSQYPAAVIKAAIDEETNSLSTILCTRDKALMKSIFSAQGIPVARGFALTGTDVQTIASEIKKRVGFPCVVKPRSAMSSLGVVKVDTEEELAWCLSHIKDKESKLDGYLCEEFIEGEEYFVDAVWADGQPHTVLIGKYEVPMLSVARGKGLVISRYVDRNEDSRVYDAIVEIGRNAVDACKLTNGVTHTEFLVDRRRKVHLGEMATRMGGGPHEELAKCATGYSLGELQARAILNDLDDVKRVERSTRTFGYVNLQPNESGLIEDILSADEASISSGVIRVTKSTKPGETFRSNGSSSWCLCCIVDGESRDEFASNVASIVRSFNDKLILRRA